MRSRFCSTNVRKRRRQRRTCIERPTLGRYTYSSPLLGYPSPTYLLVKASTDESGSSKCIRVRVRSKCIDQVWAARCMFFAASFACAHSWNKNGIASVGIDIYKLNTPGRGSFRRWAGNDARLNNVRHDSCCSYPRRLSASGSGYVATDTRPSRTTVIPDARRREIRDRWLRW